jgi:hypothetical protein
MVFLFFRREPFFFCNAIARTSSGDISHLAARYLAASHTLLPGVVPRGTGGMDVDFDHNNRARIAPFVTPATAAKISSACLNEVIASLFMQPP